MDWSNHLYYGDNLTILRERIPDESVDLIYLDPPFNSNKAYNVLFKSPDGVAAAAQIQAFDDTWHWSQQTESLFLQLIGGGAPPRVAGALTAMRNLLGTSDVNAYLVMMTARLSELHRVLKPTGSFFLHCDPTASHYLKVMLDAVFGPEHFVNEIIWHYRKWPTGKFSFQRNHDVVLFYAKTATRDRVFNQLFMERALSTLKRFGTAKIVSGHDEAGNRVPSTTEESDSEGVRMDDVWDIGRVPPIKQLFPTQKPEPLLERIITAASNEGDLVLDPFCGCGTTVDVAESLRRRWIGIDITYLAIDLITKRLRDRYGDEIRTTYTIHGVPADLDGAAALFAENAFDFERWAVSLIDAQPNVKQVGDKGIDGRVRFHSDEGRIGQALVSVKGGQTVNPGMVRDLRGTVEREGAEMGILITLAEPTRGMVEEANKSGTYTATLTGQDYPKIQIVTVAQLMGGIKPRMPTAILPYLKAKPRDPDQLTLGG